MKRDSYKNIFRAEDLEKLTASIAEMDRIAALMHDTISSPIGTPISMPFYDMPPGYFCNDGKWRYLCNDGKYRTYEEMVNDAAPSQHQGTLAPPQQQPRQAQQHAPRGIVANIRAAVAKALRYGQRRKRGERE